MNVVEQFRPVWQSKCVNMSHDDCVIMSGQNLYTPVVELVLHLSCFSVLGTEMHSYIYIIGH